MSDLKKIYPQLKTERDLYDPYWQDVLTLLFPNMMPVIGWEYKIPTQYTSRSINDITASQSLMKFSNMCMQLICPSGSMWHQLTTKEENKQDECDEINSKLFSYRYSAMSGFSPAIKSSFNMMGAIGNGFIFCDWRNDGLFYKFIPASQVYFSKNSDGVIDTYIVETKMRVIDVKAKYGYVPDTKMDDFDEVVISHYVYKNPSYVKKSLARGKLRYSSEIWIRSGSDDFKKIKVENGYSTMPYIPFLMPSSAGENYGTGIGFNLLPDIYTVNEYARLNINAAQFEKDPMWATSETNEIVGSIAPSAILEGGIGIDGDFSIKQIPFVAGGELSELEYARRIQNIKDGFMIGLMNSARTDRGDRKTATEVNSVNSEMAGQMRPIVEMLHTYSLPLLIQRELDLFKTNNIIDADELEELELKFDSPSNRVLESERLNSVYRMLEVMPVLAEQINPIAKYMINLEELMPMITYANNIPSNVLRSYSEAEAMYEKDKKQIQEAQQAQIEEINSKTNKNNSQAMKEENNGQG